MTTEQQNVETLKRTYEWANRILNANREKFNRGDVERYFAPDAEMITNEQLKCRGIEAHIRHFEELQKKTRSLVFHPFEIITAQGDRVGVYFKIDAEFADGRQAKIFISGFFRLRDGKIVNFTEIAHFDGAELRLENH
jgi:ketosteroid isomerase-like protein